MNTVIKTVGLTLSLCAVSVYAGEQIGKHKGSGSPRTSRFSLISVHSGALPGQTEHFEFDTAAMENINEDKLNPQERAHLKAHAVKEPVVMFGVDKFTNNPSTEPKLVKAPYATKSFIARLCCCK